MEKISWTDRVRNEVLQGVKKERNILHTIKQRKANWIGLKQVIEGKIEGREDEEEDGNIYWMTLREREDTGS
jgi:hypothetical protein